MQQVVVANRHLRCIAKLPVSRELRYANIEPVDFQVDYNGLPAPQEIQANLSRCCNRGRTGHNRQSAMFDDSSLDKP
jgi:hypothetical protein